MLKIADFFKKLSNFRLSLHTYWVQTVFKQNLKFILKWEQCLGTVQNVFWHFSMDSSYFTGLYLQVSFAIFEFMVYCGLIISLILYGQVINFSVPFAVSPYFTYLKDYGLNSFSLVDIIVRANPKKCLK